MTKNITSIDTFHSTITEEDITAATSEAHGTPSISLVTEENNMGWQNTAMNRICVDVQ